MLKKMLANHINTAQNAPTWQLAIRAAAAPLLQNGFIEERYIDCMIENVERIGPYIVIMPGFALPHAKPENGVLRTGVSLLKLCESVLFPEDTAVSLLVVLAANHADAHIDLISELTDILMEEDTLNSLLSANTKEEILSCLK